jgi:hypothetical protein
MGIPETLPLGSFFEKQENHPALVYELMDLYRVVLFPVE